MFDPKSPTGSPDKLALKKDLLQNLVQEAKGRVGAKIKSKYAPPAPVADEAEPVDSPTEEAAPGEPAVAADPTHLDVSALPPELLAKLMELIAEAKAGTATPAP